MRSEPLRKAPLCRACGTLIAKVWLDLGWEYHPLCRPKHHLKVIR